MDDHTKKNTNKIIYSSEEQQWSYSGILWHGDCKLNLSLI
jgi:hypothetical protein